MLFNDLTKRFRRVPNVRVLSVCTLILLRHPEVSSYSEILFKVFNNYVDVSNTELFTYYCKKLKEVYEIDLNDMPLDDINTSLEKLITTVCRLELNVAIANGYLSELQEYRNETSWTEVQLALIDDLSKMYNSYFVKYIKPCMSNRAITYAAIIGFFKKEMLKQVCEYTFPDDILYQLSLAAMMNINLIDLALNGLSSHELELIIKASQLPSFDIQDMYIENTDYIDFIRIRNFIANF